MIKRSAEDQRLTRLTEIALALPETTRQIYGFRGWEDSSGFGKVARIARLAI
jgi:hypothetical protein